MLNYYKELKQVKLVNLVTLMNKNYISKHFQCFYQQ